MVCERRGMRQRGFVSVAVLAAVILGASVTSCAGVDRAASGASGASGDAGGSTSSQTVTVYAAASLKHGFEDIADAFEAERGSDVHVKIVTDGSSTLATQILEGAPADVFASADETNMAAVTAAGLAGTPQLFATNSLVIAMPAGNPAGVRTLADLAKVTTVLCAAAVPCGASSQQLLELTGTRVTPASFEQNVTAVIQKVAAGEADAGLVYATDVVGDDAVEHLVPEGAASVVNQYPIAVLSDAAFPEAAQAFVDFVTGNVGQSILAERGFGGV